jgi:hypothetical protein
MCYSLGSVPEFSILLLAYAKIELRKLRSDPTVLMFGLHDSALTQLRVPKEVKAYNTAMNPQEYMIKALLS